MVMLSLPWGGLANAGGNNYNVTVDDFYYSFPWVAVLMSPYLPVVFRVMTG
jgi:hypothetical protein